MVVVTTASQFDESADTLAMLIERGRKVMAEINAYREADGEPPEVLRGLVEVAGELVERPDAVVAEAFDREVVSTGRSASR